MSLITIQKLEKKKQPRKTLYKFMKAKLDFGTPRLEDVRKMWTRLIKVSYSYFYHKHFSRAITVNNI